MMPDVVKNLLIVNGLFFLGTISLNSAFDIDLRQQLGLFLPQSKFFEPYQFVTHIFMHADFMHIFFNMFALWMFGSLLENVLGPKRFLIYYMLTGFGAAFLHLGVNYVEYLSVVDKLDPQEISYIKENGRDLLMNGQQFTEPAKAQINLLFNIPTVGASGAVFGLLLAFGMLFPNSRIYIYFLFPIKAKYFVMIFGAIELISGVSSRPGDNVAHFAHLGGMLFGFLLIKFWNLKRFN